MLDRDVVADDEFAEMVSAASGFRTTVNELGVVHSVGVDDYVRARLYWRAIPNLHTAGHEALANEIVQMLSNARLSSPQMMELEREYFPRRRT